MSKRSLPARVAAVLISLASNAQASDDCNLDLRFIAAHDIPATQTVDGDAFGGISGIDYDARAAQWYLVSDDRSTQPPPRLFTASLDFNRESVGGVQLLASHRLQPLALDAEAIRVDPANQTLLISGEGDAASGAGPWLRRTNFSGRSLREIPLPSLLQARVDAGPRPNRSFEGLSLAAAPGELWLGTEAPLLQDGPPADAQLTADVRLTRMNQDGKILAQYIYRTDVASKPGVGDSSDNGVSDILALTDTALLVLERSGVKLAAGGFQFHTRLYCADVRPATDVSDVTSLAGAIYQAASKRLLLDFDSLHITAGNLEGVSWGPQPGAGLRSLVFVSDNNFFPDVPTQLLFFSVH